MATMFLRLSLSLMLRFCTDDVCCHGSGRQPHMTFGKRGLEGGGESELKLEEEGEEGAIMAAGQRTNEWRRIWLGHGGAGHTVRLRPSRMPMFARDPWRCHVLSWMTFHVKSPSRL